MTDWGILTSMSSFVFWVLGAFFVPLVVDGKSPSNPCADPAVLAGLSAINVLRESHGTPLLTCDARMCEGASRWATTLVGRGGNLMHDMGSPYGENLAVFDWKPEGSAVYVTSSIRAWYREVSSYNTSRPGFNVSTGHFTQLVWASSRRLGIGWASGILALKKARSRPGTVVVARFDPPGNVGGPNGFSKNVPKSKI